MSYSIDSSAILVRYYPLGVFPTMWAEMDKAADDGTIIAVDEVYRELEKKDDDGFKWLKRHRTMIVALDGDIQVRVTAILGAHPRLVDARKNRSMGDPFVIALAKRAAFRLSRARKLRE